MVWRACALPRNASELLVVAEDPQQRQRICQALWSLGEDTFLANGMVGEGQEDRQPILLSEETEPLNGAKFMAIADGRWREGDTPFERTFFLFDDATVQHARDTWRMLRSREGVEHFYWKQEGERWVQAG